jgi:hypothetical protein
LSSNSATKINWFFHHGFDHVQLDLIDHHDIIFGRPKVLVFLDNKGMILLARHALLALTVFIDFDLEVELVGSAHLGVVSLQNVHD